MTLAAGAALFFHHSSRAKTNPEAHAGLAWEIARATAGHPLAIALLAGEFDVSTEVSPAAFLADWDRELGAARREGQAEHHVTFATAFNRSYRLLSQADRARLVALSRFRLPFFAEGAAFLWNGAAPETEEALTATRASLDDFVRRSLLRVDATFTGGDRAATYRLEPVIQRQLAAELPPEGRESLASGYAAHARWLVNQAYGEIGRDPGMASLIQSWADELIAQASAQPDSSQAGYCWQLGVMLRQFGRLADDEKLLEIGAGTAIEQNDAQSLARILAEEANTSATRGDLDQALRLSQQSLALKEQVGDLQGKSSTMRWLAAIAEQQGELEKALKLYEETLAIADQIGDADGKSSSLHQMAGVYLTRGDLDQAMRLYQQSLALFEQVGNLQGKAATLSQISNLYAAREQWDEAERQVTKSLVIAQSLDDQYWIALNTVKLGQISSARNDPESARTHYEDALAIYERLGMPEANQVRELLASLEAGEGGEPQPATPEQALVALTHAAARQEVRPADVAAAADQAATAAEMPPAYAAYLSALAAAVREPAEGTLAGLNEAAIALLESLPQDTAPDFAIALRQGLARFFDRHSQPAVAAAFGEGAIAALRARGKDQEIQATLNVLLFNQAGYLADAGRLDDAVVALEEAVAIDRRFDLPDLASDTAALARMIRRRDGLPAEREEAAEPAGPLDALSPEAQAQLEEAARQFAQLSPDEQEAAQMAVRREMLTSQANDVAEAALAAKREGRSAELLPKLDEVAAYFADGEAADSPYAQLAGFVRAVSALLRGELSPPVPQSYVERFAALRQALG